MKTRADFQPYIDLAQIHHRKAYFRWDGADYNGHCVFEGGPCYYHWFAQVWDNPSPWIRFQYMDHETGQKRIEVGRRIPGARVYAVRPITGDVVAGVNRWFMIGDELLKKYGKATREYDAELTAALAIADLERYQPIPKAVRTQILATEPRGYFLEEDENLQYEPLFSGTEEELEALDPEKKAVVEAAPILSDDT